MVYVSPVSSHLIDCWEADLGSLKHVQLVQAEQHIQHSHVPWDLHVPLPVLTSAAHFLECLEAQHGPDVSRDSWCGQRSYSRVHA